MTKRIIGFIFAILSVITLPGCWDYVELENMVQVIGSGIDYDHNTKNYTLTIQYSSAAKKNGSDSGSSAASQGIVHSATDKTLYGALSKLQSAITKKIYFGYLKVMIFGDEAAKYTMKDMTEFNDRTPIIPFTTLIVASTGKAEDTIKMTNNLAEEPSCQEIYDLLLQTPSTGFAYPTTLQQFEEMLAISGWDATLPRITTAPKQNQSSESKSFVNDTTHLYEKGEGAYLIEGTDVLKGNSLIGQLNEKESLGYGWITGKKMSAYTTSADLDNNESIIYYRIVASDSKISVNTDQEKLAVNVKIHVQADLRKYYGNHGSDFLSPDEISKMEKKLSDCIRSDAQATLQKCQKEFKSDAFGFGFELFRKNPSLWKTKYQKQWNAIYPELPVTISVDAKILNSGTNIRKFVTQ